MDPDQQPAPLIQPSLLTCARSYTLREFSTQARFHFTPEGRGIAALRDRLLLIDAKGETTREAEILTGRAPGQIASSQLGRAALINGGEQLVALTSHLPATIKWFDVDWKNLTLGI